MKNTDRHFGGAGLEDPRNARVAHHGERLALCLEPREHFAGVEAGADNLYGNAAADGARFFSLVDGAHSSLTQQLEHAVGPDVLRQ